LKLLALFITSLALSCCTEHGAASRKQLTPTNDSSVRISTSSAQTKSILDSMATILNESLPAYKQINKRGFYVSDENRCIGFFVYDLTDTSNNSFTDPGSFKVIDNHVYHFAAISMQWSISNILILESGHLKIFRAINCDDKGDRVQDVLDYLQKSHSSLLADDNLYNRVKSFRTYGRYVRTDVHSSLNCSNFVR